jgi:hypothetical protein
MLGSLYCIFSVVRYLVEYYYCVVDKRTGCREERGVYHARAAAAPGSCEGPEPVAGASTTSSHLELRSRKKKSPRANNVFI